MTRHISKRCDIFLGVCKAVCNIFPKFTDIFCSHPSRMAAFLFLREKVADLCELQIMKSKEVIAVLSAQKLSERDFPDAVWDYGGIIDVR